MEISAAPTSNLKTPDPETETPGGRAQTNGVLKRLNSNRQQQNPLFTYKECLKNHAASLGGHALDGCGEFMPSPNADPAKPTSLICAACGCHRNFHRRDPEDPVPSPPPASALHHLIEYHSHHRHHPLPPPPPPPLSRLSPNSPSPPPISSSYYPSAPNMLLALSSALAAHPDINNRPGSNSGNRKRVRTKFTQNQKEKMQEFAERVGWRIQRRDEDMISEFCSDVGVDRTVLKVWMHNNKRKDSDTNPGGCGGGCGGGVDINTTAGDHYHHHNNAIAVNGSSSLSLIESTAK